MRKIKVGINGLGRIGRAFLRTAVQNPAVRDRLQVVAANDLGDPKNIAYLLKYDTAYGRMSQEIHSDNHTLMIGNEKIALSQEKDPSKLNWGAHDVDIVLEATGAFESFEKSKAHLTAGAKRVVISAPSKDEPLTDIHSGTVLVGINDWELKSCEISSNASCTTNAVSPVLQIMHETVGVQKAVLNTVHAYTATQSIVDSPDAKDFRRGRAGAQNIAPSTTGAAIAVTKVIHELEGLFDGIAVRVPVIAGSIADVTFVAKRTTSVEEVNDIMRRSVSEDRWRGIFKVTDDPIVSSDIIGEAYASIADLMFTKVVGGDLVKILAWYDNEMGYTHSLIEHVIKSGSYLQ